VSKVNCADSTTENVNPFAERLYSYFIDCVRKRSPEETLEDFRHLFIDGVSFKEPSVKEAINTIVNSKTAEQEFKYILNRCCHILINYWQNNPKMQPVILELLGLFDRIHSSHISLNPTLRRVRILVKNFTATEQYQTLQRIRRIVSQHQDIKTKTSTSIGELIDRYPYLYSYCLLNEDSSVEHKETVRRMQVRLERKFEVDLSHYVTYQVRLAQMSRQHKSFSNSSPSIKKIENPTLLSDKELARSLKQFVGKVEDGYTYKQLSHNFLNASLHAPSYKVFKEDLYEYLKPSFVSKYGNYQFKDKFYQKIKSIFSESDWQKPDEFLIVRTSSQLLNYLVVESSQRPEHYVFVDMMTNMGSAPTIGLLLKIVLCCKKIKPYLEKKFTILFNHYESVGKDGVPWLVRALETLHVAFSIHYGKADVSYLSQIM
jgi:hypothetical protein